MFFIQPLLKTQTQQERIAPFPVKTWTDLLEDLEDPDRSGGAGDEEEEEVENTTLNDAAEAAAKLLHYESNKPKPEVSMKLLISIFYLRFLLS